MNISQEMKCTFDNDKDNDKDSSFQSLSFDKESQRIIRIFVFDSNIYEILH